MQEYSLGFSTNSCPAGSSILGYVGSKGINLTDYNHNHNGAKLLTPSNDPYGFCYRERLHGAHRCNTAETPLSELPFWATNRSDCKNSDLTVFELQQPAGDGAAPVSSRSFHAGRLYLGQEPLRRLLRQLGGHQRRSGSEVPKPCPTGQHKGSMVRSRLIAAAAWLQLQLRPAVRKRACPASKEKLIKGWNVSGVTIAQAGDPLTFIGGGTGGAYGTNSSLASKASRPLSSAPGRAIKSGGGPGGTTATPSAATSDPGPSPDQIGNRWRQLECPHL